MSPPYPDGLMPIWMPASSIITSQNLAPLKLLRKCLLLRELNRYLGVWFVIITIERLVLIERQFNTLI